MASLNQKDASENSSHEASVVFVLGKILPSEINVSVLQRAMQRSGKRKFIIDGFPRNEVNRTAFENTFHIILHTKREPKFVLFFDCPEEELTRRLLNRNQGRADDNPDTIQKRLKVFKESTLLVINYYISKRKVQKIDAEKSVDEVFEDIKSVFSKLNRGSKVDPIDTMI